MCLVVFAWQAHPEYRLIVAANRDEQHARPAEAMHWWPDQPDVLAGRDLQAGGTWLALSRDGRFATVTNFREHFRRAPGKLSRGRLVTDFVTADEPPLPWSERIEADAYAGFSLLASDGRSMVYTGNRSDSARELEPGLYGLSNATLDTPWPKLVRSRETLATLIDRNTVNPTTLMRILADPTPAPIKDIDPNLPVELARAVSAPFIKTERYGTRCSTVLLVGHDDRALVIERRFGADGQQTGEQQFRFELKDGAQAAAP